VRVKWGVSVTLRRVVPTVLQRITSVTYLRAFYVNPTALNSCSGSVGEVRSLNVDQKNSCPDRGASNGPRDLQVMTMDQPWLNNTNCCLIRKRTLDEWQPAAKQSTTNDPSGFLMTKGTQMIPFTLLPDGRIQESHVGWRRYTPYNVFILLHALSKKRAYYWEGRLSFLPFRVVNYPNDFDETLVLCFYNKKLFDELWYWRDVLDQRVSQASNPQPAKHCSMFDDISEFHNL
jgi:hypothetical protein